VYLDAIVMMMNIAASRVELGKNTDKPNLPSLYEASLYS
jgi:hypothetical protein